MVEAAWSKKKYCDIQLNTQFRQHILIMSWESRLIIWRVNKTPDKSTCMWIPNTDSLTCQIMMLWWHTSAPTCKINYVIIQNIIAIPMKHNLTSMGISLWRPGPGSQALVVRVAHVAYVWNKCLWPGCSKLWLALTTGKTLSFYRWTNSVAQKLTTSQIVWFLWEI